MEDAKAALLLEEIESQFRISGKGLQMLNAKVDKGFTEMNKRFDSLEEQNRQEHKLMREMIKELSRY